MREAKLKVSHATAPNGNPAVFFQFYDDPKEAVWMSLNTRESVETFIQLLVSLNTRESVETFIQLLMEEADKAWPTEVDLK